MPRDSAPEGRQRRIETEDYFYPKPETGCGAMPRQAAPRSKATTLIHRTGPGRPGRPGRGEGGWGGVGLGGVALRDGYRTRASLAPPGPRCLAPPGAASRRPAISATGRRKTGNGSGLHRSRASSPSRPEGGTGWGWSGGHRYHYRGGPSLSLTPTGAELAAAHAALASTERGRGQAGRGGGHIPGGTFRSTRLDQQ